jgi:hypothetical protein
MENAQKYGLPEGYVKIQYERVGGVVICPECRQVLGIPKQNVRGTNMRPKPNKPLVCPVHGVKGILKYATKDGNTYATFVGNDGKVVKARAILDPCDLFDKNAGRAIALYHLKENIEKA